MKLTKALAGILALMMLLTACGPKLSDHVEMDIPYLAAPVTGDANRIELSDNGITLDGTALGTDPTAAVYTANDIVYYESGKDFTYGEGTEEDTHSPEEAAAHTVVHITQPGTYTLSGKLSKGQVAVDLGDDAKINPNAVVTLILDGVDITCEVAPAVIFYNVYECGINNTETAERIVDTSAAGANVVIADSTTNNVTGSYVARIYKPDSVVLNEEGTEVEDAKKLHKYDAAFYSKRTMNIFGEAENTGVLNILAANEGLDSELHLTINGGNININSGNDGINTNEDGVSVTTINGGNLNIQVNGATGEGDGIDSNGWLVINGGTVVAQACSFSADAGIDSDMGIHINGGTVIATGSMLDRIEDGGQNYAVFNFAQKQNGGETITLKNQKDKAILETTPANSYSILIFSSPDLKAGTYTLWSDGNQLAGSAGGGMMGGFGGPGGGRGPGRDWENPEDQQPPQEFDWSEFDWSEFDWSAYDWSSEWSEGDWSDEDYEWTEGDWSGEDYEWTEGDWSGEDFDWSWSPEGFGPPQGGGFGGFGGFGGSQDASPDFEIVDGGNQFTVTFWTE